MKKIFAIALGFSFSFGTAQAFTNCVAQAERKWNGVTIEASSQGDTCADAVLTLVVRDKAGKALWTRALISTQLLNFSEQPAVDSKAMITKLSSWISGEGFMPTVDRLNLKGEFPFKITDGLDAKTFASYQKQKRPVFCYVQGQESGACLMLDKVGGVIEIGYQLFPG